ncbi:MAG TPA: NAD-binding protein, partial [Solirubrobacteraceae bacterium]|nr:NAD-binding protein [Solirubrobacteraceae bacterium]
MFVLIVGAGRVGSSVARSALAAGHEVSVLDEDPLSHERLEVGLEAGWEDSGGRFTVGTGIEIEALRAAGVEEADVFIASTDGDNTNLTIAQIARKRYG